MMLRAPKFNSITLEGMRTLLRLDFARSVRYVVQKARVEPIPEEALVTAKILELIDRFTEAEQPLLITLSIMKMHGAPEALMPLNDDLFELYGRIITRTDLKPDNFKGIPEDQLHQIIDPLKAVQEDLKKAFDEAAVVDRDAMEKKYGGAPAGTPAGKTTGFLN